MCERERGCVITNLGEGVDATGFLKPEAMQRVACAIQHFQERIATHCDHLHRDIPVIAVATSASRDAKNSAEFLALLEGMGINLRIISGEQEAQLSFRGVSNDFKDQDLLVIDIGGGSTELSAGNARSTAGCGLAEAGIGNARSTAGCGLAGAAIGNAPTTDVGGLVLTHSFDIGCRRVTERFLASDPPSAAELESAQEWVRITMEPYFQRLKAAFWPDCVVAVAGTATSVVSIHEAMETYDSAKVHRSVISRSVLEGIYRRLSTMTLEERKQVIGLDPGRAHVIVAGLLILREALMLAEQDSFTVSESDILQGILLAEPAKPLV
ncbi:MAG: hypothetical protein LBG81_04295 [Coriobacteriaceae bacterium]|nr:hypothetical protein [Coriobacteriaceae bacterium]